MSRILTVHIFLLQETQKRPAKTELAKRAKKQKVNNVRTAKSTCVGTAKSVRNNKSANVNTNKLANVDTNKSANVGTNKLARTKKSAHVDTSKSANVGTNKLVRTKKSTNVDTNNSAIVGTNKSPNVGTNNSANVGTNKSAIVGTSRSANSGTNNSANVGTNKSANIGTIKSANVEAIKLTKASKTTQRGKQNKSPVRQRKPETGRKGRRVASPRNSKKTTTKTKPKRASRSLGKERTKKGVNGTTAIAPEDINSELREHVEDDTGMSADNSEDNAPLIDTESGPKQNGTVEENGEVTDSDSVASTSSDEQLTHENTVPSAGGDSDAHGADHESNMHAPESIETGPHTLDEESSSAKEAGNESSSGSERSCTPLSNYIANKSVKGCKITIKKSSNGFISGDECGVVSRQHGQSGACSEKAKSRKSFVPDSTAMTAIASCVVEDCKTDGSTVDHDVVSHTKSDTNADVVSDSEVGGPSESTLSDVVSVSKTDKAVVDLASCCKTDASSETCDVPSRCKTDKDPDVHDVALRCEADAPAVTNAMSDCETGGAGELIIAEPEHNGGIVPETDAAAPETIDMCANVSTVTTECASSKATALISSRLSNDADSVSLAAEENDQSFTKPERENQEIDTAEKSPSELSVSSDDDTELTNNNVTLPAACGEPIRLVYDWLFCSC